MDMEEEEEGANDLRCLLPLKIWRVLSTLCLHAEGLLHVPCWY